MISNGQEYRSLRYLYILSKKEMLHIDYSTNNKCNIYLLIVNKDLFSRFRAVLILISWHLMKPVDLDLLCFQKRV